MEFLGAGLFVSFFLYVAYQVFHLHLRGQRTTAIIVELRRDDSSDGTVFYPKVRFTTSTGTTIIAESTYGTPEAGTFFRVGEKVDVRYLPSKPTSFAIVGYEVASLILLFALAALALAIACEKYWSN